MAKYVSAETRESYFDNQVLSQTKQKSTRLSNNNNNNTEVKNTMSNNNNNTTGNPVVQNIMRNMAEDGYGTGDIEMGATVNKGGDRDRDRDHHSEGGGVKDQVREQEERNKVPVGKRLKHTMGYRPKHPVALFHSLSGCVIEVVESKSMPSWSSNPKTGGSSNNENALWVDINKVTGSVLGNAFGTSEKNAAKMRKSRWKEELIHMLDSDGDGEVEPEEVLEFLTNHEKLRNDPTIQRVLESAHGKSTTELMKELKDAFPKIIAALVANVDEMEAAHASCVKTKTMQQGGNQFTKHMQLHDFYKDPEGIKVRARKGAAAIECLVANDPGGIAANLGAGLMLPITTALRQVGYVEGDNFRGYNYDWRLPVTKLEERDSFLSNTLLDFEELYHTNHQQRIVVVAHSLGTVTAHYFFHWVAHSPVGQQRGGVHWLQKHIQAFVPMGGLQLGAPGGSVNYLNGDAGMSLSPMVLTRNDQHILIRSWGMFGGIFPTGRQLMLNPTSSVHWVRKEGILKVHLLDVEVSEQDEDDDTQQESSRATNKQYYVSVYFTTPATQITDDLHTTPFQMSTMAAIDEQMQFSWTKQPTSIDGSTLKIAIWRDWIGPVDKKVEQGTFELSTDQVTPLGATGDNAPFPGLQPNEWVKYTFELDEKTKSKKDDVKVTVKLQFVPYSDTHFPNDFRRTDEDPGVFRCGGPFDVSTSPVKKKQLTQTLGPIQGVEWSPTPKGKFKDHRDAEYAPMTIDQMMVVDNMEDQYKGWKHCYMDDPIWNKYSTEPPEGVNRITPIYGINVETVAGSVHRQKTKLFTRLQPTSTLQLDPYCDVAHPGFEARGGIIYEVPHKTPQADDPLVPVNERTYQTRASGDGTVSYWSMRWPITWRAQGFTVNPLEVEGEGHRGIVSNPLALEAILTECCHTPVKYLEVWIETVSSGRMEKCLDTLPCCLRCLLCPINCLFKCLLCLPICLLKCAGVGQQRIFVDLMWRNKSYGTETILTPCQEYKVKDRRFVLGVTELDLENDAEVEFSIKYPLVKQVSQGTVLSNTVPVKFKLSQLVSQNNTNPDKPESLNTFDDKGQHTVTWYWKWSSVE